MFSGLLQLVNISVHRQIFTSNESKRLFAYAQSFALYHKSLRVGEIFWVVARLARDGLVGARLRRDRSLRRDRLPANMGVAQLASDLSHYLNSRMRPIFSFPAAPAAAVTPEACPYQRTHR